MTKTLEPNEMTLLPDEVLKKMFPSNELFARYGTEGKGSCFFNSVCAALNKRDYLKLTEEQQGVVGVKFRKAFTEHLTKERWDRFKRKRKITDPISADQVIENFNDPTYWANETIIKYVSDVMKLNIIFIDMTAGTIYCGVRGHKSEPLIMITWLNKSHFEPVCRVLNMSDDAKEVQLSFVFDMKNDATVVNSVMNSYQAQCSNN